MEFTPPRRPKQRRRKCRHRKHRRRRYRHRQPKLRQDPRHHYCLRRLRIAPAALRHLASPSRKVWSQRIRQFCRSERAFGLREPRLTTERTGSSIRGVQYANAVWTSTFQIVPRRGNSAADPFM